MPKKNKTKVTGAKTSINTRSEAKAAGQGYMMAGAAGSGDRAAKALRKSGLGGTAQNPSPAMHGARVAAGVLGEDSSRIPMRKKTVRSLTTDGPKPSLQTSPVSGRDIPLPATSNKSLVKDAKALRKTAGSLVREARKATRTNRRNSRK